MAQALIGGRTYAVAPFKLRELRLAAPFIDRVAARAPSATGVEGAAETAFDMLCVLAVGIEGATAEALAADASLEELTALRITFDQVLAEAGLTRSEPGAAASGEVQPAAIDPPAPPPANLLEIGADRSASAPCPNASTT